jgi:hypothetical protein
MLERILEFYLTDHYMPQGWDRKIDESILYKLLPFVNSGTVDKKIVVFTPAFYISKGIDGYQINV